MIRYIIVDDEFMAHEIIKAYAKLVPSLEFKQSCNDALEALDFLKTNEVDLIFLDLNMPQLKGFEFIRTLKVAPKIIVTTAYSEHALEGYELNITDYLLKPFSLERFLKAVNKASDLSASQPPSESSKSNSIFITSDKKHFQIKTTDILFIEASGNYSKVQTVYELHKTRKKISDILEALPSGDFIQVHKSFAVAKKHITSIEGNRIFLGDHTIPIGQLYKANIKDLIQP